MEPARLDSVVAAVATVALTALGACGSEAPAPELDGAVDAGACRVTIVTVGGQPAGELLQIDPRLDDDPTTPAVELAVEVTVDHAPPGLSVTLEVTGSTSTSGVDPAPTAPLSDDGARLAKIAVDLETTPILTLRATAPGCEPDSRSYNTQAAPRCTITAPGDGVQLGAEDDRLPGNATLDIDVTLAAEHADAVDLLVEGAVVVSALRPEPAPGETVFSAIALPPTPDRRVALRARVTAGELSATCGVEVTALTDRPSCLLAGFAPAAVSTAKGDGLGPAQDAEPSKPGLQTTLVIKTSGDRVELLVDGAPDPSGARVASGGEVSFALDLDDGTTELQARCGDEASGYDSSARREVRVDTAPPAAIDALTCALTHRRRREIRCSFDVPADGPSGSGVERCLLASRRGSPITAASFEAADVAQLEVVAGASPTATGVVSGLELQAPYHFAARCFDHLGNAGPVTVAKAPLVADVELTELAGVLPGARFGATLASGDFNCDGLADLAVGAPDADQQRGEVRLLFGDGAGFSAALSSRIVGSAAGARVGSALAALDHNGDGCDDLAATSAPIATAPIATAPRVYLYLGRPVWDERTTDAPTPIAAPADVIFRSSSASDDLGALAGADVDGDGAADLALTLAGPAGARLVVDFGDSTRKPIALGAAAKVVTLPGLASLSVTGGLVAQGFGAALTGGDLDGDGKAELAVGAPSASVGGQVRGAVFVIRGGPRATGPLPLGTSARVARIDGPPGGGGFGHALRVIGDLDGNAAVELAVAAPTLPGGGRIYLFELAKPPYPTGAVAAKRSLRDDLPDALGPSLAGGDFYGDGLATLVLTIGGSVKMLRGRAGLLGVELLASQADVVSSPLGATTELGATTAAIPDFDGDGLVDVVVTDPGHGAGLGRLVFVH